MYISHPGQRWVPGIPFPAIPFPAIPFCQTTFCCFPSPSFVNVWAFSLPAGEGQIQTQGTGDSVHFASTFRKLSWLSSFILTFVSILLLKRCCPWKIPQDQWNSCISPSLQKNFSFVCFLMPFVICSIFQNPQSLPQRMCWWRIQEDPSHKIILPFISYWLLSMVLFGKYFFRTNFLWKPNCLDSQLLFHC